MKMLSHRKDEESGDTTTEKVSFWKSNFLQVILLSISFMFIFTSFQTTEIIEETVLQSIRNESSYCPATNNSISLLKSNSVSQNTSENETIEKTVTNATAAATCPENERIYTFTGNGYTSLSILYAVFAIASWLAPSLVAILHAKWSMIISASTYVVFIASFLFPITWLLYLLSALLGAGAAVLWTGQGKFLSLVSDESTITRYSGIFWAINQCSFFIGNLLVYWQLQGKTTIDEGTRRVIFVPLTILGVIGVLFFSLVKNVKLDQCDTTLETSVAGDTIETVEDNNKNVGKPVKASAAAKAEPDITTNFSKAIDALVDSLKLFITPNMLLLSLTSIYTGLEFSYLSGVYSTAVGNTKMLGPNHKTYVGLVGILLGIGEVVGGSLFGLLGARTTKKGRTPIVLLGAIVHMICFVLTYLNLPNEATLRETSDVSVFSPPLTSIALICAFLLGFGDACFQTQLIATFASVYKESSAPAFAIFKFTQSAASAASFYSSSYLGIVIQVVILLCSCLISLVTFGIVEWKTKHQTQINDSSSDNPNAKDGTIEMNSSAAAAIQNSNRSSTNNTSPKNPNTNQVMSESEMAMGTNSETTEDERYSEKL